MVATLLGVAFDFADVSPMRALVIAALINGVVAVPALVAMLRLAAQRRIMGDLTIGAWLTALGWTAVAVMAAMALSLGWVLLGGS